MKKCEIPIRFFSEIVSFKLKIIGSRNFFILVNLNCNLNIRADGDSGLFSEWCMTGFAIAQTPS